MRAIVPALVAGALPVIYLPVLCGCSLLVDTSGLDTLTDASPRDASFDGARDAIDEARRDRTSADRSVDTSAGDARVEASDAGDESDGGLTCPSGRGPTMIDVGAFCVDSTEVTKADYEAFLKTAPDLAKQPAVCSWNATFVPGTGWPYPAMEARTPVVYVNWCDAYAFCQWAGKRLCGAIGGGSVPMSDFANPSVDQHFFACSMGASRIYPYGDTWDPARCNDVNAGYGKVLPVGSLKGCAGGFPGLYDMVGNVEEWQDSCVGTAGAMDVCADGTGAYDYPGGDGGPAGTRCDFLDTDYRNAQFQDVGFRCCSP
jgi:formylglycine-generating enzyme required for sulfatase activity